MSVKIRIIAIPNGEAPEHIRQAWVGIEFEAKRKNVLAVGVLSGPQSCIESILFWFQRKYTRQSGYAVKVREAVDTLAKQNPQAAEWWQQNCPALIKYNGTFIFGLDECQEI